MTEHAGWTSAQISGDLKMTVSHSDGSDSHEIARYTAVLSNHLKAAKAANCKAMPMSKTGVCGETWEGDGNCKDTKSGAGSRSVGGASS